MRLALKNLVRSIIWFSSFPVRRRLDNMRGLHTGETCYLFGDGPSIKYFDLANFNNFKSIASNQIVHHLDFHKLKAQYWVLPDAMFYWPFRFRRNHFSYSDERRHRKAYSPKQFKHSPIKPIINATNIPFCFSSQNLYFFDKFAGDQCTSISSRPDAFAGTVNTLITIAIHLGFKRAYLVGFDYTHNPSLRRHWYERGPGVLNPLVDYNKDFFQRAQEEIELFTVTLNGLSDCLPSISYKDLTGSEPIYCENTSLLKSSQLAVLSGHRDYTIF